MSESNIFRRGHKAADHDPFVIREGGIKDSRMGSVYRFSWAEEMYQPEAGNFPTVGKNFNFTKVPMIGFILFCFMLILAGKTAWLQVVKGEYYYNLAEGNRIRTARIEPKRGVIYDRRGLTLVRNQANFLLYFTPADLPAVPAELDMIIDSVSGLLGSVSPDEIRAKLSPIKPYSLEAYQPLFIADNIEYEPAMALYIKAAAWPGVTLANKTRREYLSNQALPKTGSASDGSCCLSLAHILGYTGKISEDELAKFGGGYSPIDYIGKMGVEYFWENELKGSSGIKQVEVDALGKEKKIISQTEAEDGHNLVLALDLPVQNKLEEILWDHLNKLKLDRAAAIILDPSNGEIMAMVSLPAYNNNLFARGISREDYAKLSNREDRPLFNRAISGEYPSGSTIKPILAAAALEEGIINEHTSFLSVGGIRIGQWFFPDWLPGGHGTTDVKKALAQSVNTFFYYIGGGHDDFRGLGIEGISRYGSQFGLNAQTGVDLAGEASGFLPTAEWKEKTKGERWYIGDTYHLAIGQGDLSVTPLQVAAYTAVFANGGALYRPHFIRQVLDSGDRLLEETPVEPVRDNFISLKNIEIVRQGLRAAVTGGSARRLQSVPVAVAGKTGTAQWSSTRPTHAWFTGFAPYDEPALTVTVLVEEGGEGSETAVPIAEEFLKWYFGEYKKISNF
ncbi:MAG: penicillin-binding protein 2 [Planctomycetes bacterium]|nr:penicillin-binding protein 2 [Planctomycetota bacterium]